ncbi:MAG: pilus assembly protein [Butyrivibrio sp.]|nr:pilus assembly protein [Butyrivibrio sp.]
MKISKRKWLSGSMTLEASIALPLFIFFFLNIMSAIWIIQIQSELEAALHQTGSEVMQLAYDVREGEDALSLDEEGIVGIAEMAILRGYAVSGVNDYMGDKLKDNPVMDGIGSLSFLSSKVLQGNDIVDIVVDYKVHPIVNLVGFKGFDVQSRFYAHAWTGYDIEGVSGGERPQEELVYITEHGEVYHRDISCRYLKSGIRSIAYAALSSERNEDGKKFYPCEYCGKSVAGGNVFITKYGTRYHSRVDCQGLKRKIYTVPISEVGGRRPCSACGG